MTKLLWDQAGSKKFETGVDQGVLYLPNGLAVPWNGLTSVIEHSSKESSPVYYDGIKVNDSVSLGDFSGTMKAVTYPDEFLEVEGAAYLRDGVLFNEQKPKMFGLCYRTRVGTDISATAGYKLHILYNLKAVPTDKAFLTMGADTAPIEFEWDLTAVPVEVDGFHPTAHIVIDSTTVDPALLSYIEGILYGTSTIVPSLIPIDTLVNYIVTSAAFLAGLSTDPKLMVFDSAGAMFVMNSNATISKILPNGTVTQTWATLSGTPTDMCIDANNNIYVLFDATHTVSKVTSGGGVTLSWKVGIPSYSTAICVNPSGDVYICNYPTGVVSDPGKITKITSGQVMTNVWATVGPQPVDIFSDKDGNIYTISNYNGTVWKSTPTPVVTLLGYVDGNPQRGVMDPFGNIFTCNYRLGKSGNVSKITPSGKVTKEVVLLDTTLPVDICSDPFGTIYVANGGGKNTVTRISKTGFVILKYTTSGNNMQRIIANASGDVFFICGFNGINKIPFQ